MTAFITADQVADLTGHASGREFLRKREELERHHAFPQPMPTLASPMKWRRDAVEAWAARQGQPATRAAHELPPGVVPLMAMARSA